MEDYEVVARRLVGALDGIEFQILECMVRGMSNREIAEQMGIEPETLERFRSSMMTRLNAKRASDAVRIGLHAGLDMTS